MQRRHLTHSELPGQTDCTLAGWLGCWLLQGADSDVVWTNCSPDNAPIHCSDKLGAALTKRTTCSPLHFACWTICFFWGALPQLCLCAAIKCLLLKSSWRGRGEKKWLVTTTIFFCLKDADVSCFGITLVLYLPLQVSEFPIFNVTH